MILPASIHCPGVPTFKKCRRKEAGRFGKSACLGARVTAEDPPCSSAGVANVSQDKHFSY